MICLQSKTLQIANVLAIMFAKRVVQCLAVAAAISGAATDGSNEACAFARSYKIDELFNSTTLQDEFLSQVAWWEGKFASLLPKFAYEDYGIPPEYYEIDLTSGLVVHMLSRIDGYTDVFHTALLASAMDGNKYATMYFTSYMMELKWNGTLNEFLVDRLSQKIFAYIRLKATFPGFNGFLPTTDLHISAHDGITFAKKNGSYLMRASHNGYFAWGLAAAAQVLREKQYIELAAQYQLYLDHTLQYAVQMFYKKEQDGLLYAANISDILAEPSHNDGFQTSGTNCFNDEDINCELFVVMLTLYGNWSEFPVNYRDKIWRFKQGLIHRVDYTIDENVITTENVDIVEFQSKHLMLPYLDIDIVSRVFLNTEKVRTLYAAKYFLPGLLSKLPSSVHRPNFTTTELLLQNSFAAMLHPKSRSYGVAWFASLLQETRMQTPYGSRERVFADGSGKMQERYTKNTAASARFILVRSVTPHSGGSLHALMQLPGKREALWKQGRTQDFWQGRG